MINEKFKELINDKKFVTEMANQPTVEDAKKMFIDEGVPITDEEMDFLGEVLNKIATKGMLSEEDLNNISGSGCPMPDISGDKLVELGRSFLGLYIGAAPGATAGLITGALTGSKLSKKFSGSEEGAGHGAYSGAFIGSGVGVLAGAGIGLGTAKVYHWWKSKKSKKSKK